MMKIDHIENSELVASFERQDKIALVNGQQILIWQMFDQGQMEALNDLGLFVRERETIELTDDEKITGYSEKITATGVIEKPVVAKKTAKEKSAELAAKREMMVVSMKQARMALLGTGLLDTVQSTITAMEGINGEAIQIEWQFSPTLSRNSETITGLADALGLDDDMLDQLFEQAATI